MARRGYEATRRRVNPASTSLSYATASGRARHRRDPHRSGPQDPARNRRSLGSGPGSRPSRRPRDRPVPRRPRADRHQAGPGPGIRGQFQRRSDDPSRPHHPDGLRGSRLQAVRPWSGDPPSPWDRTGRKSRRRRDRLGLARQHHVRSRTPQRTAEEAAALRPRCRTRIARRAPLPRHRSPP